jgi:excisionase family DNA binding protein
MSDAAAVIVTTPAELRLLIKDAVREELAKAAPTQQSDVMTREQVADMLQVHIAVVSRYVKKKGLPAVKIGRDWRFRRGDVLAWMEAGGAKKKVPAGT